MLISYSQHFRLVTPSGFQVNQSRFIEDLFPLILGLTHCYG